MELLDRYLQAVSFWLPKAERADVAAELADDIRSQIHDREAELGRALTDAEVEAILRRCGHPLLVAERYLPQEHLIGPALFPIYRFVLKMVALVYALPWLLVWIGLIVFMPSYRAAHPGFALAGTLWGLVEAMLYLTAAITIAFAVLERMKDKGGLFENWNPRTLPAVRDPRRIRRFDSLFDLAATLVCGFWLASLVIASRSWFDLRGVHIALNPAWRGYAWIILAVLAVAAVTSCVNVFRPYWTPLRASVRLAYDLAGAVTFGALLKSQVLAGIVAPDVSPERAEWVTRQINGHLANGVVFVIIVAAVTIVFDLRRLIRANSAPHSSATGHTNIAAV